MLLSFILPVYNVEKYLNKCVDSILSQLRETDKCEILLIDDGSPDSSGIICDEYALKDKRIRVIHKKNEGVSVARNVGIDLAIGKYIAFVDSDDIISDGSIRKILSFAETSDAEMCFMQTVKLFPDGTKIDLGDKIHLRDIENKSIDEIFDFLSTRPKFPGGACSKLFLRKFIKDEGIYFPVGIKHGEDLTFCRDCLCHVNKLECLDIPYYEYRQSRPDSTTSHINMRMFNDISIFITSSVELLCDDAKPKNERSQKLLSCVAYEYSILLWRLYHLKGQDFEKAYMFLRQYKWIMNYGKSTRSRIINILRLVLGVKLTARILWFAKR